MSRETKVAIRRVLRESSKTPNFFDLSDSERLVRMIGMAYQLGRRGKRRKKQS